MNEENLTSGEASDLQDPTAELVCKAREGDTDAFGELYIIHEKSIMALLIGLLPTRADAEDFLNQAFLNAWKSLCSLDHPDRFKAWLLRIAHNLAMDWHRGQKHKPSLVSEEVLILFIDEKSQPPDCSEAPRLAEILAILTQGEYEVCVLFYLEGLSPKEVSSILDIPIGAVYTRTSRIRDKIVNLIRGDKDESQPE